ncbi:ABC transporter ATP-binding protein [Candidatus Moduliflexota bacterium]
MGQVFEVRGLTMDFGGLRALDGLDLHVDEGEIVALIGPNGAGKTTFFNCITGLCRPSAGDVVISPPGSKAARINGLKPNLVTERGLARTFQNIRLFPDMTVLENVMVGRHCRTRSGVAGALFRSRAAVREERDIVRDSYAVLRKVGLENTVNDFAKNLPYGDQRRLEVARAMATDPFLLLLDEPAAGMNPRETKVLDDLIVRLRDEEGISVLLIEHDMRLVMSLSDRVVVMESGKRIAAGTPAEIGQDPEVVRAYLGEGSAETA